MVTCLVLSFYLFLSLSLCRIFCHLFFHMIDFQKRLKNFIKKALTASIKLAFVEMPLNKLSNPLLVLHLVVLFSFISLYFFFFIQFFSFLRCSHSLEFISFVHWSLWKNCNFLWNRKKKDRFLHSYVSSFCCIQQQDNGHIKKKHIWFMWKTSENLVEGWWSTHYVLWHIRIKYSLW